MDSSVLKIVEKHQINNSLPPFGPGDTIAVHTIIREEGKQRIQIFRGIVIAIKGSGIRKTFTIRKISHGIGVERIFPMHSPNIGKIELLKKGKVRRAKLYYMRDKIGKQAMKVKAGTISAKDRQKFEELEKLGVVEGKDETPEDIVEKDKKLEPESKEKKPVESKSEKKDDKKDNSDQKKKKEIKQEKSDSKKSKKEEPKNKPVDDTKKENE